MEQLFNVFELPKQMHAIFIQVVNLIFVVTIQEFFEGHFK